MNDISLSKPSNNPLVSLYGENSLLSPLGPRVAFQDLPARLSNNPLRGLRLAELDASTREELLILHKQNFVPTSASIKIAASLQTLHREHYWQRHPNNPSTLRKRMRIAQLVQQADIDPKSVPWLSDSASGMIIKGITGTGKTAVVERYMSLLTAQVHEHTNGDIPGFDYLKQIAWLKVDMSSDGSRDGFLTSILDQVDNLVNTSYTAQYSGRYSVDKLAIKVAGILSVHLCGMLIIEEIQEKNFNDSKWHNPLTTFFLRILNFGVPVVLIGNPLGFTELERSSQNVRRLSSGGIFEVLPAQHSTDDDFRNLVHKTALFNVMECRNAKAHDYYRQVAYAYSGGITDFVVRLNKESQRMALHCGAREVRPEHIDAAFESEQFKPNHPLILGLANRNRFELCKCSDVPVDRFVELWKADDARESEISQKIDDAEKQRPTEKLENPKFESQSQAEEKNSNTAPSKIAKDEVLKPRTSGHPLAKQFKSQQTRETNRRKQASIRKELLSPDDIRNEDINASLVAGLKDLLHKVKK